MKLRTKYILFVAILHLVTLVLTWFIFTEKKIYFIASEALIIVSLVIATQLYSQLIKPLKYLMQGIEAIKDRDFNVKFLTTGKHEVDQLITVYNQMIDELRVERTRQEQQHFFLEKLIYTSPTGIIILNHDHGIEHLNPKALEILGADAAQLQGFLIDQLPQPLFKNIRNLPVGEARVVKPDGMSTFKLQKAHFIDRGFSRQFIMIEELTAEILAAEKNVYGKVIRMMAHEVNNTIGPVNSIMQSALITHQLWANHQFNSIKDALQVAVDRNQNLNLFMRNFAELVKLPLPNKQRINLNTLLSNVVNLMSLQAGAKNIELIFNLPAQPIYIMADEQLLEQAIINIVKNSIEAIDEIGTIELSVNEVEKTVTITDTGSGIFDDDVANLFSPFYSTKKDGQGIGLTLVREILLSHGWQFSLKTVGFRQTVFSISY
ncbi:PAS domain-containing protein [Mucilaginibacter gracilis]|uniref:histidine kinase n=2 Tax=Mucilaginibacter gracilis TaxID=423350 RepID=A0A495J6B9_9SPHI|nr:PAS domain-containing protein [Mucilaginibacter gracilis]